MAALMWRMNGVWRRVAGVLVLVALLLSNEVTAQDDVTTVPAAADPADPTDPTDPADPVVANAVNTAPPPDPSATPEVGADPTVAAAEESTTPAPGLAVTILSIAITPDKQDSDVSETTAAPAREEVVTAAEVPYDSQTVHRTVVTVMCTEKEDSNGVRVLVDTDNCEETRNIMLMNSAHWCGTPECTLKLHQKDKELFMASDDVDSNTLLASLTSEPLKDKLNTRLAPSTPTSSSSDSSVFVGVLVSGLLAALAITVGYFKCQRRSDTKGVRLAEEAYPVDQENQGNTLVSVAPLNPPPETQEKPSVNGESPEAAKTQPSPPTNGHSTTKTADTEM